MSLYRIIDSVFDENHNLEDTPQFDVSMNNRAIRSPSPLLGRTQYVSPPQPPPQQSHSTPQEPMRPIHQPAPPTPQQQREGVSGSANQFMNMLSPSKKARQGLPQQSEHSHYSCRGVYEHMEECPMCSDYFKKETKFYWLIIGILLLIVLYLLRKDLLK